jgi:hypothetical protein
VIEIIRVLLKGAVAVDIERPQSSLYGKYSFPGIIFSREET